jgi:hypothetical protein
MGHFNPCAGNNACNEDGTHCRACGRSHDEIARTRAAVDALVALAMELDYDNPDELAAYVARRVVKKLARERERAAAAETPCH